MSVEEIEKAIRSLPPEDLSEFRTWFEHFDAEAWDLQFEQDVAGGKLDKLTEQALSDLREGRCTDL